MVNYANFNLDFIIFTSLASSSLLIPVIYNEAKDIFKKIKYRKRELTKDEKTFLGNLELASQNIAFLSEMKNNLSYSNEQQSRIQRQISLRHECVIGGFNTFLKLYPNVSQTLYDSYNEFRRQYAKFDKTR